MDLNPQEPAQRPDETTGDHFIQGEERFRRPSETGLFTRLNAYPFVTDKEFAKGLSIILGHPESPADEAEISRTDDLVLQAKCFYFSKKENLSPPLSYTAYKNWMRYAVLDDSSFEKGAFETPSHQLSTSSENTQLSPEHLDEKLHEQEPAYPSSFSHIVELITTGQPIPGIQQIPDTILTGHDTSSAKPRRQKPWEK